HGFALKVSLKDSTLSDPSGRKIKFELEEFRKDALLKGLDEIGITLSNSAEIKSFESSHQQSQPWLFTTL
nr:3-isopropylmalate dehydratase small subunit [Candidatus Neomarinimicrobiota bacterium]